MHLDDCLEIISLATAEVFSPDSPSRTDDIYECVTTWALKTTTSFHNNEDLTLPWWFGALCFSFALSGIANLIVRPTWSYETRFPYVFFALVLIFVQAPLSFMADYIHMTNDSPFHVIDRFIAVALVFLEVLRIVTSASYVNSSTLVLSVMAFMLAMFSFMNSQISQNKECTSGFIFWHALWHIYPFLVASIVIFDKFVLGQYDDAMEWKTKGLASRTKEGVRLLSTVAMKGPVWASAKS